MADMITQHNIAAYGTIVRLAAHSTATAGGTGDNTLVVGKIIDRVAFSSGMPSSLLASIVYTATLTSAKSLSLSYDMQDSADGTNFADFQSGTSTVVVTGSSITAFDGTFDIPIDLLMARRFLRLSYTPDLSATATDVFGGDAIGFFAGFPHLPAPA